MFIWHAIAMTVQVFPRDLLSPMPCSDYADISLQALAVLIMDQTMNIPAEQFQLKTSLKFVMPTEQR